MSVESAQRAGNIASTTSNAVGTTAAAVTGIFAAAGAANAVPIAGQVAAGVLALGGVLTKIFMGKKQARERRRLEAETRRKDANIRDVRPQPTENLAVQGGVPTDQRLQVTAPVQPPQAPVLQYNDGGQQPTMQPPQELV